MNSSLTVSSLCIFSDRRWLNYNYVFLTLVIVRAQTCWTLSQQADNRLTLEEGGAGDVSRRWHVLDSQCFSLSWHGDAVRAAQTSTLCGQPTGPAVFFFSRRGPWSRYLFELGEEEAEWGTGEERSEEERGVCVCHEERGAHSGDTANTTNSLSTHG